MNQKMKLATILAVVSLPGVNTAASATQGQESVTYDFSNANSQIAWTGSKIGGHHDGTFGRFSGSVELVGGSFEKSRVEVTIDTTTLTSAPEALVADLKSRKFLDVARFPTAHFVSTALVSKRTAAGITHLVSGNLELHGVTKSITFPAVIQATSDAVAVDATFTIRRQDFGISPGGLANMIVHDDVTIRVSAHAHARGGPAGPASRRARPDGTSAQAQRSRGKPAA
jgi:polyisoprenoid-binding protein YceI